LKRMRHHMEYRYSGVPALKVIDFLSTFKEAMDVMRVSEGLSALLLPHALDGDARSGVQSLWKQGIGKTPKYPTAVNWLLEPYATETVIDQTTKDVLTASQAPGETEDAFASRLRCNATEAGSVFTEDTLISVYLTGLHPYAANTVRGQVTSTMKFAAVRNLAIQAGAAGRARASGRDPVPGLIPARSRSQVVTVAESTPSSSYGGETYPMMGGVTPIAALEPSSYANSHIDSYSSDRKSLSPPGVGPVLRDRWSTTRLSRSLLNVVDVTGVSGWTILSWTARFSVQRSGLLYNSNETHSCGQAPGRDPPWVHLLSGLRLVRRRRRPRILIHSS
jgi:hypothetical protein